MVPGNITKEHILRALAHVGENGVPANRRADTYELRHEGTAYPAKYLVSIANFYANGHELDPSSFHNSAPHHEANKLLARLGFEVVSGQASGPQFWWLSQGARYDKQRAGGYIWAQEEDGRGRKPSHWSRVAVVRTGDILVCVRNKYIVSIATAKSNAVRRQDPEDSGGIGFGTDVDYKDQEPPIKVSSIKDSITIPDHPNSYPFDKNGDSKPGYIYSLSKEAGMFLLGLTGVVSSAEGSEADKTPAKRNPPWRREELILALSFYLAHPLSDQAPTHPGIIELSALLNKLPFNTENADEATFRNPNSVVMKLINFRSLDPSYAGKGLAQTSRMDRLIWDEFYGDQGRLHREAENIRALVTNPEALFEVSHPEEGEEGHQEGALKYRLHRARERSSKVVEQAKKAWGKDPRCEVCGLSFGQAYPGLGEGFIEAHHRVPLAELGAETVTKARDLAPVCANCHRMLHLRDGITIGSLRAKITRREEASCP